LARISLKRYRDFLAGLEGLGLLPYLGSEHRLSKLQGLIDDAWPQKHLCSAVAVLLGDGFMEFFSFF